MSKENIEIIEHIMQLKISEFIKNNKKMDKKELVKNIEKMLKDKENMYSMEQKELEEILRNKK